jgi:hypothetical protein
MIVTDEQRRWWFATHPEYSWSYQGGKEGGQGKEEEEHDEPVRSEEVDAYVDNALNYVHGPVADLLRSVKRNFGTEGDSPRVDQRQAFLGEADTRSDGQTSATNRDNDTEDPSFWDAVLKGIDYTLQDWETWLGLGGLRNRRRKLADNMKVDKGPKPDGHAAHHIVAHDDKRFPEAIEARKVLEKFGIDLDESVNGVWLPNRPDVGPGAYHPSLHNGEYYRRVHRLLRDAATKEEVIDILKKIGQQLSAGTFLR